MGTRNPPGPRLLEPPLEEPRRWGGAQGGSGSSLPSQIPNRGVQGEPAHKSYITLDFDTELTSTAESSDKSTLSATSVYGERSMRKERAQRTPSASNIPNQRRQSDCSDHKVHQELMVEPRATVGFSLCSAAIRVSLVTCHLSGTKPAACLA